ncbi:uncharacterised protein [Saccharolobus solfataricus]|uniref:Uncharacterized protein n=1 Tax=Saccharolobus solfataricus TaxID=2287 RepID=A0A157T6C0_SACSO|nr:uncharacterised protein [Saccharolobus solfataricus]
MISPALLVSIKGLIIIQHSPSNNSKLPGTSSNQLLTPKPTLMLLVKTLDNRINLDSNQSCKVELLKTASPRYASRYNTGLNKRIETTISNKPLLVTKTLNITNPC